MGLRYFKVIGQWRKSGSAYDYNVGCAKIDWTITFNTFFMVLEHRLIGQPVDVPYVMSHVVTHDSQNNVVNEKTSVWVTIKRIDTHEFSIAGSSFFISIGI